MQAEKQAQNPMGQVFVLVPDCDATQLKLTAAEGYLLSRIDGSTPWRLLREMGGISVEEADSCVARWLEDGLLEVVRETGASPSSDTDESSHAQTDAVAGVDAAEAVSESRPPLQIDESLLDDRLELDLGVQRRILEFEASLGWPYHELLDVPKGSDPKVVKRAYFKLSREFHPDRYFRKEIGHHAARLERIFKKVLEAHEMLSDPDLCEVENQREPTQQAAVASGAAPTAEASAEPVPDSIESTPKVLTKLARLQQRMPFKIDHAGLAARRDKAQEIFRAAQNSQSSGRLSEAEASIRIAISFDPSCAEFKEALGSIRIEAAGSRATKLLASPSERMSDSELREALTLLEDVLIYRPHDPELNDRAARVCIRLGKFDAAHSYVETLIEGTSDVAAYHTLMGQIHRERNELDAAISAFEMALKIDGEDLEARRALASVRIGERNAAQRGTS